MVDGYLCFDCRQQFKAKSEATKHVRRVHNREPRYPTTRSKKLAKLMYKVVVDVAKEAIFSE